MNVQAQGEEDSSSAARGRFLITTISGRYLALAVEAIQGIMSAEEAGYFQDPVAQGVVYGVIDLVAKLNLAPDHRTAGSRVVLLAEGEIRGSVRVTKIHGVLEIFQSEVLPLPAHFRGPEQRWYRGMILFERSVALVLNTTWVLDGQLSHLERTEGPGSAFRLVEAANRSVNENRIC